MDIVMQLRMLSYALPEHTGPLREAATEIEDLRLEVDRLGESLNKCHEQMMGRTDGPVHGPELERSLSAGGRYRVPECGGFQGFED